VKCKIHFLDTSHISHLTTFSSGSFVPLFHPEGPLQKTTNRQEYNKVVDNLMFSQGITRKEAEKEYNAYLENPNNYALNKVRRSIPTSFTYVVVVKIDTG